MKKRISKKKKIKKTINKSSSHRVTKKRKGTSVSEDLSNPRVIKMMTGKGTPFVYVEKGITTNLGDYNSAKVTLGICLPIDFSSKDMDDAMDAIEIIDKEIVNRLEFEVDELLEDI